MPNMNYSTFLQGIANFSDYDASASSGANSGNNTVVGGLLAINAGNPAISTAVALNLSPITQNNVGVDLDTIVDPDILDIG